jgi:hypothetical protein
MTARKSITLSLSVDSVEQLRRLGAAFFEEPALSFTNCNCVGNIAAGASRSGRRQWAAISIDGIKRRQGA